MALSRPLAKPQGFGNTLCTFLLALRISDDFLVPKGPTIEALYNEV
jgi:hypothetical protein